MFNVAEPLHKYLDDMIITHYIWQGVSEESIGCFQIVTESFRKIGNLKFTHDLQFRDLI